MDLSTVANIADADKVDANFGEVLASIQALDLRITNLGNPVNGGGELVVVDDYPTIEDAQAAARACGGELFFRGHEYLVNFEVQHMDVISGESRHKTVLKAAPGSNANVIKGKDAAALFAAPTYNITDGANQVVIKNLTVDGDRDNNPTDGDGVGIWGYATTIQDVIIRNARHNGLRTGWSDGSVSMEGTIENVLIDNVGWHGWSFSGPHDSHVSNLLVIDASQELNNTYTGILVSSGNARFFNAHVWHRSTTANRAYAAFQSAGGCEVVASHFEGCRGQQVRHNGAADRFIGCLIYAPFGANGTSLVVINGNDNQHIGCRYQAGNGIETNKNVFAIQFGDTVNVAGNMITEGAFGGFSVKSPFNFYMSAGLNRVTGRGYADPGGATAFGGTVNINDEIDYVQGGTSINCRKPRAYPIFASNTAAASGGVPYGGMYFNSSIQAVSLRN